MMRSLGKQVMRGLGFSFVAIIIIAVAIVVITVIWKPSDQKVVSSFLGPGRIIESVSGRKGLDSHFWARYECDPAMARNHLKKLTFPSRGPQDRGMNRLIDQFINPPFAWPSNIKIYTQDWIIFETGIGNYVIVAFPDDDTREVFFLKYDT